MLQLLPHVPEMPTKGYHTAFMSFALAPRHDSQVLRSSGILVSVIVGEITGLSVGSSVASTTNSVGDTTGRSVGIAVGDRVGSAKGLGGIVGIVGESPSYVEDGVFVIVFVGDTVGI